MIFYRRPLLACTQRLRLPKILNVALLRLRYFARLRRHVHTKIERLPRESLPASAFGLMAIYRRPLLACEQPLRIGEILNVALLRLRFRLTCENAHKPKSNAYAWLSIGVRFWLVDNLSGSRKSSTYRRTPPVFARLRERPQTKIERLPQLIFWVARPVCWPLSDF